MAKFCLMFGKSKKEELSSRQLEVLNLLRRGLTNGEICRTLNISENTVKTHLANIYKILDVTNRTEAASIDLTEENFSQRQSSQSPNKREIVVAFEKNSILESTPLAYSVVCATIEALHQYHIFKIQVVPPEQINNSTDYQIKLTATHGSGDSLFITLYQDESSTLLWSNLQKIKSEDEIKLFAARIAIQIFRNMTISAASKYAENSDLKSDWWYASSFANVMMENRNRDEFSKCESSLQSILDSQKGNGYLAYTLANVYYTAIIENWVDATIYTSKIGALACEAMRNTPYSAYSQFMMALYNILIGNKSDAIAYFEQILEANPQDVMARRYLTQIFLLVGKQKEALKLLDENSLYIPDVNQQPFQLIAKSFIYLLQDEYEKCELISQQVLMIHPETPFARLFMIACNNKKGNLKESHKHVQKLREYHPNFKKNDVKEFLKGVTEEQQECFISLLWNLD